MLTLILISDIFQDRKAKALWNMIPERLFLCNRKFLEFPITQKTLRGIALRRSGKMSQRRPAAGGESRMRDSLFCRPFIREICKVQFVSEIKGGIYENRWHI